MVQVYNTGTKVTCWNQGLVFEVEEQIGEGHARQVIVLLSTKFQIAAMPAPKRFAIR